MWKYMSKYGIFFCLLRGLGNQVNIILSGKIVKKIKSISINPFPNKPWFLHVCSTSLLKTVGKGDIARNKQFLLFPHCFLPFLGNFSPFSSSSKLSSANSHFGRV